MLADIMLIHPLIFSQGQKHINSQQATFLDLLRALDTYDDEYNDSTQRSW
jgi:hypothetical protein